MLEKPIKQPQSVVPKPGGDLSWKKQSANVFSLNAICYHCLAMKYFGQYIIAISYMNTVYVKTL